MTIVSRRSCARNRRVSSPVLEEGRPSEACRLHVLPEAPGECLVVELAAVLVDEDEGSDLGASPFDPRLEGGGDGRVHRLCPK